MVSGESFILFANDIVGADYSKPHYYDYNCDISQDYDDAEENYHSRVDMELSLFYFVVSINL